MKTACLLSGLALLYSSLPLPGNLVVHYAKSWDWAEIAAKQSVDLIPGLTPIAHWDCDRKGEVGVLVLADGAVIPVIVADCTAEGDIESVRTRQIVAEVPFHIAEQHGFDGGGMEGYLWLRGIPEPTPETILAEKRGRME